MKHVTNQNRRIFARQMARPLTEDQLKALSGGMRPDPYHSSWCNYVDGSGGGYDDSCPDPLGY